VEAVRQLPERDPRTAAVDFRVIACDDGAAAACARQRPGSRPSSTRELQNAFRSISSD